METQKETNVFSQINNWMKESVMLKLFSIGILILLLMIPSSWIKSLMEERQDRMNEVFHEVSDKWSGRQSVSGPVLVLPYRYYETVEKDSKKEVIQKLDRAFFLPDDLEINVSFDPKKLNRGIFDVIVYNSSYKARGSFTPPSLDALNIDPENVIWDEAKIVVGINDLRGINEDPGFIFGNQKYLMEPGSVNHLFEKAIATKVNIDQENKDPISFELELSVKGSGELSFLPLGKKTQVFASGAWADPSFGGAFIPEDRVVNEDGFTASWNVLHYNRPYPQQWTGYMKNLQEAKFGVQLLMPVDQYQKSIRSAKYSILLILLTFVALFLIEIICKIRIHAFQYILIGAALIIYYSLLLSVSEHTGFNLSYFISSLATVTLLTAYGKAILPNLRIAMLLSLLLVIFYSFIFVIIQLQDYALLIGSIGLFLIIGVLMYVSRKVNWYGDKTFVNATVA